MRITFTLHDAKEISERAYRAFFSTFRYDVEESESDHDNLDSDFSEFDDDLFGCGPITEKVEERVENT